MTLLVTVLAAVTATVIWYVSERARGLQIGMLCYLYWGASIMWFVDALMEYAELRAAYFTPALEEMVNDLFLGLSVIALGLVIWVVRFLMKDPEGVVRQTLRKNH